MGMTGSTNIPAFKGKPLVPQDIRFQEADFLSGDFGKAVNEEVQGKYGKIDAIKTVKYSGEMVRGSNPFYVVAANEFLRQVGARAATQADLENVLRLNVLDLRGTYEDTALVLIDGQDPNAYLANDLIRQLEPTHGRNMRMPVAIPLTELTLVADGKSPYGLRFGLKENAQVLDGSILTKDGQFSSKDINEASGLHKKLSKDGDRTLYTRNSGLSRLYLNRDLDLYSNNGDLAYSNDNGRVVVVSAEGASQNLYKYVAQLEQQKAEQIAAVEARFGKAKALMLGQ